jgi:hypothetical protein
MTLRRYSWMVDLTFVAMAAVLLVVGVHWHGKYRQVSAAAMEQNRGPAATAIDPSPETYFRTAKRAAGGTFYVLLVATIWALLSRRWMGLVLVAVLFVIAITLTDVRL